MLTSLIGREHELSEVLALLGTERLVTLTGSGGVGKTRLALAVAAELVDRYPDGVWLVELAALTDPSLVPHAAAQILELREEPGRPLSVVLSAFLQPKRLLLVLDNCEHLVGTCADLATALLRTCPDLHLLATSREGLGVAGEALYRVPSLAVPDPRHLPPVEMLATCEAVQLFVARAHTRGAGFSLTAQNAAAVAQICARLDGIPLAIELAAARVSALPVETIAARLAECFRLLTGGPRTVLPRQQTLRAALDWSHDLLSQPEQVLLRRLAVFAGGWTLEAAEQICAGEEVERWDVLDLLSTVVNKSLVLLEVASDSPRYRLLETVRQYARERLAVAGEAVQVGDQHLAWCLALAEQAEEALAGPEQDVWLVRLEVEHDNLRAALTWVRDRGVWEAGVQLAGALWRFWQTRSYLSEGRGWLEEVLAKSGTSVMPAALRAHALYGTGNLARMQGDFARAVVLLEESLAIYRDLGDKGRIAQSLDLLGFVASNQGDYARAVALHEESLALDRELGDKSGIASSLNGLGIVASNQGDYARAVALHEESLAISRYLGDKDTIAKTLAFLGNVAYSQGDRARASALYGESLAISRKEGDKVGTAWALSGLGEVAYSQGDYAQAGALHEESLAIFRELGVKWFIACSLRDLGLVASRQGDYARAVALYVEGLAISREEGDKVGTAFALDGVALLAGAQSQSRRAAQLWGAADAMHQAIGAPRDAIEQAEYDLAIGAVRAVLGEEAFAAAWTEGRAMSLDEVISLALSDTSATT
jgi:non-specific serine/threonine protein kinase